MAAIRNADANLASIEKALSDLGLIETTDILVTSDHGFSTISKASRTSPAAAQTYRDTKPGELPPGFLALDLATGLGLPLFDPDADERRLDLGQHPSRANGLIGTDPRKPDVVVAANGGSDLVYIPGKDPALAQRVRRNCCRGRIMSAACSSIPRSAPSPAPCRSRPSIWKDRR